MNSNPLPSGVNLTDPTQLPAMLWLVEMRERRTSIEAIVAFAEER
jgi:hypothetical protein